VVRASSPRVLRARFPNVAPAFPPWVACAVTRRQVRGALCAPLKT
jgi:hypothetical protein